MVGEPPLKAGRLEGITVDYQTMRKEFLEYVGWDTRTTIPGEESLRQLGMDFLLDDVSTFRVPSA
jgi:aldehyde:ferredoxin oxidoreductase